MPDNNDTPTVSFPSPVYSANGQLTGIRTVHVVIVKESVTQEDRPVDLVSNILLPLGLALIGAILLIWLLSKIKPGSKTNRIINRFEGFNAFFDGASKDKS